jgi:hypothetical protein
MRKMSKTFVMIMFMVISFYSISSMNVIGHTSNCIVKFDFDGLQAIAFGDSSRVSDGILDVAHHTPNIEIKKVENGKEKILYTIKSEELKNRVINITVPNRQVTPTRYFSADMTKDSTDFKWCLDIENDLFQKQLYLKNDKFFCKIHFLAGEFIADHITDDKYQFISDTSILPFNRQIGEPGARLSLTEGDSLVINGLDKQVSLPYTMGISYRVSITNLPPQSMANIDHFAFYYDVIKTDVRKFMPVPVKKAAFVPKPLLCGASVFGKSTIE